MEESRRSGGDQSGEIVLKNKSASGCLIVRKKSGGGGGVGSSFVEGKNDKKRSRLVMSESGSSNEFTTPRVAPVTLRVCNGLSAHERASMDEGDLGRKRNSEVYVRGNEDDFVGRNVEDGNGMKWSKLDVFDFDEYDDVAMMRARYGDTGLDIEGRRFSSSIAAARGGSERRFEAGSSRGMEKRSKMYFDRPARVDRGAYADRSSIDLNRDDSQISMPLLREKYADSDKPIRVQGKNGVLKVMVNKRKTMGGEPSKGFDNLRADESRRSSRIDNMAKRNVLTQSSYPTERDLVEKPGSFSKTKGNQLNIQKSVPTENKDSDKRLKMGPKKVAAHELVKRLPPTKNAEGSDEDSGDGEDGDTLVKRSSKNVGAQSSVRKANGGGDKTPTELTASDKSKDRKVRRGSGTEKQRLREQIRGMLQSAGWTIDYRPRRNRDYLDAVYINPAGTAFWSIIKAYDALQKQLAEEEEEGKCVVESSPFAPLSDDVLSQLTRKTQKKLEKEKKMEAKSKAKTKKGSAQGKNAKESVEKQSSSIGHDEDLSCRPHLSYDLQSPTERVGNYDTQLVEHFFLSLASTSGMALHIRELAGKNFHHIIEATFKAFARALRKATEYDLSRLGTVPRGSVTSSILRHSYACILGPSCASAA